MARTGPATQLGGSAELTLLAHVKPGFVEGTFGTHTYAYRLEALLKTLNAMRLKVRQELTGNPFADIVAGIGTIESFRYVVLPADHDGGPRKLLLNVIFDRAWEPYMRFIYRDIGALLDVIFCNCEEYPFAYFCSFDEYMRWVRKYEIEGGLFYTDSPMTVGDRRYLKRLEVLHRGARNAAQADIDAAALAVDEAVLPLDPTAPTEPIEIARRGLPALVALYELNLLYPVNDSAPLGGDAGFLLRSMHDLLRGLRALPTTELFDAASPERRRFARQLEWLERPRMPPRKAAADRIEGIALANVQGGILHGYDRTTHGCLLLMRVTDPARGRAFLGGLGVTGAGERPQQGQFATNVALTFSGLRQLGVPGHRLDLFPAEFREGMEARCGSLGDLRGNHPANWRRPERNWPPPPAGKDVERIELDSVHIVVQLRVASINGGSDVARKLADLAAQAAGHGVELLSVQEMNVQRNANGELVEHFGFVDSISQPTLENSAGTYRRDRVPRGDILLGYANSRGDGPWPAAADALFDDGSFLVVRKLRQDVPALNDWLDRQRAQLEAGNPPIVLSAAQLKEAMLGRRLGGKPLIERRADDRNDFDFREDPRGMQCPLQSHVRRANPRNGSAMRPVPRIVRRGMLYGPPGNHEAERGVMFMAYNASIAEQFEVVQRWIAGGNSSGLCSAQSDPLLGVPQPGEPRTFRFFHEGRVARVDLDTAPDRPFVRLEWGAYLFVPSKAAIGVIAAGDHPLPDQPAAMGRLAAEPTLPDKLTLEDIDRRAAGWAAVRAYGGVAETAYGVLVGSKSEVMGVFRDDGSRCSVRGYGQRMSGSIGRGYLGVDEPDHARLADGVNAVIEGVGEREAFMPARGVADKVLSALLDTNEAVTGRREATFDIRELADRVLATLCSIWFGLPDAAGALMRPGGWTAQPVETPLCPGHLMSASRYVFHPDPSPAVERFGKTHGAQVLGAVKKLVANSIPDEAKLSRAIAEALDGVSDGEPHLIARTIAGVMMGFPPTVFGNVVQTARAWLESRQVWSLQSDLLSARAAAPDQVYERARDKLRTPMVLSMQNAPVPDMLWRTETPDPKTGAGRHVVVGILSAAHEDRERGDLDEALLFGGERKTTSKTPATHACPGRYMATGVMLGVLSAILEAGSLRAAGPTGFTVSRR